MPHHKPSGTAEQAQLRRSIHHLSTAGFRRTEFKEKAIRQLGLEIIRQRQGAFASSAMPDWPVASFIEGRRNIVKLFGLENKGHFFHARPVDWVSFHEPQITGGFAHFLNEDNEHANGERVRALLESFGVRQFGEQPNFRIEAEAQTKDRMRIDLQIIWSRCKNTQEALIVEAKFGHSLTSKQLTSYQKYGLEELKLKQQNLHLFVLTPGSTDQHRNTVLQNKHWREISWFGLLISYERFLPRAADSNDFRRFRRTVWHRASS